jgi:hypothetical protein
MSRKLTAAEQRIFEMADIIEGHFVDGEWLVDDIESRDRQQHAKIAIELAT